MSGPISMRHLLNPMPEDTESLSPLSPSAPVPSAPSLNRNVPLAPTDLFTAVPLIHPFSGHAASQPLSNDLAPHLWEPPVLAPLAHRRLPGTSTALPMPRSAQATPAVAHELAVPPQPLQGNEQAGPSALQFLSHRDTFLQRHRAFGLPTISSVSSSLGLTLGLSAPSFTEMLRSLPQEREATAPFELASTSEPLLFTWAPDDTAAAAPKTPQLARLMAPLALSTATPRARRRHGLSSSPNSVVRRSARLWNAANRFAIAPPAAPRRPLGAIRTLVQPAARAPAPYILGSAGALLLVPSDADFGLIERRGDQPFEAQHWLDFHRAIFEVQGFSQEQMEQLRDRTPRGARVALLRAMLRLRSTGFTPDNIVSLVSLVAAARFLPTLAAMSHLFLLRGYTISDVMQFLTYPDPHRRLVAFRDCSFDFAGATPAIRQRVLAIFTRSTSI